MSALLQSVSVLGLGFAPPALAAPASAPTDADVAWAGDTLHVRASGPEASAVAVAFLIRTVRGLSLDPPLASWERDHAARAMLQGQVPVARVDEGPVCIALTAPALARVKASWGRTARWHDRIPLAMSPDGPVVLERPGDDLALQAGDVLQAINGVPVTTLDDIDGYTAYAPMEVLRNGIGALLVGTVPMEAPSRSRAPTCGPCCHGHCQDDVPAMPIEQL